MMRRSRFLALIGSAALVLALGGCTGLTPVYGDLSAAAPGAARFNFAEPGNRTEQIILNRLRTVFPNPAGPDDPVLSVSAGGGGHWTGISDAFEAGRPLGVNVSATVRIMRGDEEVFSAQRTANTSYQSGGVSLADRASSEGALEVAARSVAESLRAAILAGYRPLPAAGINTPRH